MAEPTTFVEACQQWRTAQLAYKSAERAYANTLAAIDEQQTFLAMAQQQLQNANAAMADALDDMKRLA